MAPIDIDYLEKVSIPFYESLGWVNACKDMRLLIGEIRRLLSERSDNSRETENLKQVSP